MNRETKIRFAKKSVRFSTSIATGLAVRGIIRNNIEPSDNVIVNLVQDASIIATSIAVSMMAKDAIGEYTDKKIDAVVAQMDAIHRENQNQK